MRKPQMNNERKPLQEQIRDIKTYLWQLIQDLEYDMKNLNQNNMSSEFIEKNRLPVGCIVLAQKEGVEIGYGEWKPVGEISGEKGEYTMLQRVR